MTEDLQGNLNFQGIKVLTRRSPGSKEFMTIQDVRDNSNPTQEATKDERLLFKNETPEEGSVEFKLWTNYKFNLQE